MLENGPPYPETAKRIRAVRRALGKKAVEITRLTGIAANTYSQYESGKSRPDLVNAAKLAREAGVTLDWIYFGDLAGIPMDLAIRIRDEHRRINS